MSFAIVVPFYCDIICIVLYPMLANIYANRWKNIGTLAAVPRPPYMHALARISGTYGEEYVYVYVPYYIYYKQNENSTSHK